MANDDYNIQKSWDAVCRSFAETTKLDLTTASASRYTIEEVLGQIRARQDEDDQRNAKYRVAKDVISKTLTCIEVLGGIASQGASMVFGPSALCFNAVSYLIKTGTQFKRIFSSIGELFKRISDILERCKIYLRMPPEAVDISLRRIINDELLCFVDICALSTKVLKGHKVLIALKVFAFNDDEGVGGQLARLKELVERESQMRATLGFESQKNSEKAIVETRDGTKKINAGVDKLLEYHQQDEKNNTEKKQLQDIDNNLDNPSNSFTTMQGKYRELFGKKVEGSGQWLLNDEAYIRWASKEAESPVDVLCISGGEGYGKSHLFATVIRDLQDNYSKVTDDLSYTSIAYYFFEEGNTTARGAVHSGDNDSLSLVKALKTLAYEVAMNDLVFRKDLVSSTKSIETNKIERLWDVLFAKSYKADSTFFILLDGADRIVWENLKSLLSVLENLQKTADTWGSKFRLRILFSARDETVTHITKHLNGDTSVIDVASNNKDDIELFINNRLGSMDVFSSGSSQVEVLEKEILDGLMKGANGDFVNVDLLLNEISGKQRPGEIREVLSRSGEKRSDTIARKVQRLNETLSEDSISDLNELLVWVINAQCSLTLKELEAVLYVKNGEPSLRSLADEIHDKFSAIFRIDVDEASSKAKQIPSTATVSLVSKSIEDYFREKSTSEEEAENHDFPNQGHTTGDVTESEVEIVRRFLNMVCDPKLFKKFEFDSFFERKLTKRTARLGLDTDTAHLRILTGCLKSMTMGNTEESSGLVDYATFYFQAHLNLIDLSLIQPQSKAIVGPLLIQTFLDEELFKAWWKSNRLWMRTSWLYDESHADSVLKWLQDSAVTKRISAKDLEWIKSLSSKSKPDADLLEHVARWMARNWLQDSNWETTEIFYWVNAYVNKIANRKDPNVKRETSDPKEKKITTARILEVAEWSRQCLGFDSLGYEETRNLARTLREFEKFDDAVDRFRLAMSLQEDNWMAKWGLAVTYSDQKKYDLAIETLEEIKALIENEEAKESDPRAYLNQLNRDLADWNHKTGNIDKAWDIYVSILQENPADYETAYSMISLLHGKGNYSRLLEFLEDLKRSIDEATGLDRRIQIFHQYYWNDEYHDTIAAAGHDATGITTIKESYLAAIDAAEKNVQLAKDQLNKDEETYAKSVMALLMHHYAKFFYASNKPPNEKEIALDMWVRIIQLAETGDWYLGRAKLHAVHCLSSVYFQQAVQAEHGSEQVAKHIEDLEHLSALKMNETATKDYSLQLLARYYALCGKPEQARDAIRPLIKLSIDLLSDDDPENDWQGHIGLAMNFMFAGQDDNALAAWSLITPNKDVDGDGAHSDTEGTDSPQKVKDLDGPIWYDCDGKCGLQWHYANDIYVCRECADVQFHEGCLKKLREGTLKRNVCSKDHDMLHVPKYDEQKLKAVGEGNVMIGQETMTVEDWIQKIKQEWGFTTN